MPLDGKILFRRAMIVFFILQIAIDLAHSVTLFPFVHYGMFSESFPRPDSLMVFEVTVDGQRLQASSFRIYRWDMIQTPLTAFDNQKITGDFAFDRQKLQEYLQRAGAGRLFDLLSPQLKNNPTTAVLFPGWYKSYLGRLLGQKIGTVQVDQSWYRYANGHLLLLHKENYFTI
jgi:hypothetical protein